MNVWRLLKWVLKFTRQSLKLLFPHLFVSVSVSKWRPFEDWSNNRNKKKIKFSYFWSCDDNANCKIHTTISKRFVIKFFCVYHCFKMAAIWKSEKNKSSKTFTFLIFDHQTNLKSSRLSLKLLFPIFFCICYCSKWRPFENSRKNRS